MKKPLLFLILLIGIFSSKAQQFKEFSPEPEQYLEEMVKLFARSETNVEKERIYSNSLKNPGLMAVFQQENKRKLLKRQIFY